MLKEVQGEVKDRRIMKMLGKGYLDGEQVPVLLEDLIAELTSLRSTTVAL
jgi:hypothetical protein